MISPVFGHIFAEFSGAGVKADGKIAAGVGFESTGPPVKGDGFVKVRYIAVRVSADFRSAVITSHDKAGFGGGEDACFQKIFCGLLKVVLIADFEIPAARVTGNGAEFLSPSQTFLLVPADGSPGGSGQEDQYSQEHESENS